MHPSQGRTSVSGVLGGSGRVRCNDSRNMRDRRPCSWRWAAVGISGGDSHGDRRSGVGSNDMTTVRVERSGPVTTVILDRPEVRNAVDRATALALADAFRAFDADDSASVAVLWGAGGTFCSGRGPDRVRGRRRQPGRVGRGRPDGTDPHDAVEAGDRRCRRTCRRRRPRTRVLVRPAGGRGGRGVRRVLPTLGRAADRRRHRSVAATDRYEPSAGHDPDRPGGRRRARRTRSDWRTVSSHRGSRWSRRASWRPRSRDSRR